MKLECFHLKAGEYRVQPWKNGLGETREIAVDTETPFRWRVSWAKLVGSGPFSVYPGYDRSLVLLKGGVATLSHDGKRTRVLPPMVSYTFQGEWETQALINDPAEDFNVFALRDKARAGVYPTYADEGDDIQFPLAGDEHFLFCLDGQFEVFDPNEKGRFHLFPTETLRVSRRKEGELLNVRAKAGARSRALWVTLHLL